MDNSIIRIIVQPICGMKTQGVFSMRQSGIRYVILFFGLAPCTIDIF